MDNKTILTPPQPKWNTYVGARYVPIFAGAWDDSKTYEPLVIVEYQGNSYTSKTFVPAGVEITNTDYWALTGNYNAQVEYYRQEVADIKERMMNGFINVVSEGIKNDGATDVTADLNTLLSATEYRGRTFYFPGGTYIVSGTINFNTTGQTSFILDNGAIIKANKQMDKMVSVTGGENLTTRVLIMGGTFDCNYLANRGIVVEGFARNLTLFNCTINSFLSIGLHEVKVSEGGRHLMVNNVKIMSNTDANLTTGLRTESTDNYFSNLNIMAGIGLDFNNTGGHKLINIHCWSANTVTPALYSQTVGILNSGENLFTNLYIDTYYRGIQGGNRISINNLIIYWYNNEAILNYDSVGILCGSGYYQISNFEYNNANQPNAKGIMVNPTAMDATKWFNENRLAISNITYRQTQYPDVYINNINTHNWTYTINDTENWYFIGAIMATSNACSIYLDTTNFSIEINVKSYADKNIAIGSINILRGKPNLQIAFKTAPTEYGRLSFKELYVKLGTKSNVQISTNEQNLILYNNQTLMSADESELTVQPAIEQVITDFEHNYTGTLTVYNLVNKLLVSGTITKTEEAASHNVARFAGTPFKKQLQVATPDYMLQVDGNLLSVWDALPNGTTITVNNIQFVQ